MTDVSSVKAHADPQPVSVAPYSGPPAPALANGSPTLDGPVEEEESSTIKCICGFADDDGNTVLCEKCDTWQHIVCYYEYAQNVPDIHECTDCLPRIVDAKSATEKQQKRRELHSIGERKGKPKLPTKGAKKRPKDPLSSVQPNGWPVHSNTDLHYSAERKSGSPRDQPPPNKRPKTSHRPSGSTNMISQVPALAPTSRKRAASTLLNGHSPVKSPINPEGPIEDFSLEFMHLYRQPEPPSADSNSYTDIQMANDISLWLNDRDALEEATGGVDPKTYFSRIDKPVDELECLSAVVKHTDEDPKTKAHGLHPQWQFLTLETTVPKDALIGELKGRIGRIEHYKSDPLNRWDLLRHPEPFVFFPPHLPVYIDTRREGSLLRYARRSCNPNMTMKILTHGPESRFHFCFLASRSIEIGEELTVPWEIDSDVRQQLTNVLINGDIKKEGFRKIEPWVACVLANFGGCACDNSSGYGCLLERVRRPNSTHADAIQLSKLKAKKTKKSQISPLSTGHATNSRATSEANNRDQPDDENMDTRSTSGSRKSSSRDITPATHFSMDGDLKMSDRERRKIQQQEQMSPTTRNPREHSNGVARKTSGHSSKCNGRALQKPKPVYVDSSTQTADDKNSTATATLPPKAKLTKPPVSFKRRLLQQAQEDKLQRERIRSASVKQEVGSPALKDVASAHLPPVTPSVQLEEPNVMDISTDPPSGTVPEEPTPRDDSPPAPLPDVEMKDADEAVVPRPTTPSVDVMPDAGESDPVLEPSHAPTQPPPPPWPSVATISPSSQSSPPSATAPISKPIALHLDLSKPDAMNITGTTNVLTPGSVASVVTGGTTAPSPVSATPVPSPFSVSVAHAMHPGPARKKLSLSDYTSRRAKLAQTQSTGPGATPPLVQAQSMSSPTLSTASLPNQASPPGKSAEPPSLPTVTEEPKPISTSAVT
ncbi:hypothetical protein BDV95DRAFT_625363 [Massariosphaeria phaeospora]|uniref:SET domain-containing protein n=1 Tax=Massariosphaeria phaeospora TaxID=100035 RepID=A0A7C8IEB0_9PLEO|nr:hypothetical protein BDV95DRAFT_625363 [Massariosphaeria phaeospora]